jgi:CTP synthase
VEALSHGGLANGARVDIDWIDAVRDGRHVGTKYEVSKDGPTPFLVPGGFGHRGIKGKVAD